MPHAGQSMDVAGGRKLSHTFWVFQKKSHNYCDIIVKNGPKMSSTKNAKTIFIFHPPLK